jgi:chemotaxis protein histidine kinase CheA
MPKENELPELLKPLVRRQAIELRNAHFGRDAEAVIEKIKGTVGLGWRVPAIGGAMAATLVVSGLLYWTGVPISLPWATRSEIRAEQEGKAKAAAEAERTRANTERRADLAEQERKARAEADLRLASVLAEVERSAKVILREQQERNATAAAAADERARAERIERERLAAVNAEVMARAERAETERRTARKTEERARAERAERERREAMAATERAERERRTARKAEERARAERPEGDSRTARKAQSTVRVESPERKRLLAPTVIAESHEGDGLLTRLGHRLDAIGRAREAWQRGPPYLRRRDAAGDEEPFIMRRRIVAPFGAPSDQNWSPLKSTGNPHSPRLTVADIPRRSEAKASLAVCQVDSLAQPSAREFRRRRRGPSRLAHAVQVPPLAANAEHRLHQMESLHRPMSRPQPSSADAPVRQGCALSHLARADEH